MKQDFTIVIATHNMQQAARVSDQTAFFNLEATGKPGNTLTPLPADTRTDLIDTSRARSTWSSVAAAPRVLRTVSSFAEPRCRVITGVGRVDPALRHRAPQYVEEDAPWSAFRDREHPYGFVAFDVDPGRVGRPTSITATQYAVTGPLGDITPVARFTLTRPTADST